MSRRGTEEPQVKSTDRGRNERHPAFGVAVVTRGQGTPRALFQSDLLHHQTITLSIHRATRDRDLNRDWVFPTDELIQIEMSLAQWGSLVSSVGLGSGVPVTLRRTETEVFVPGLPHQPRTAENLREVRGVTDRMYARVKEATSRLRTVIDEKRGVRAIREALHGLEHAVDGAGNNAEFAINSLVDAAETVVSQARSDVEAHLLEATRLTGQTPPIEAPPLTLELEAHVSAPATD